jgi:tetratricopeptide (TPR) repeat protein
VWVENDPEKAIARAKAEGKPVFTALAASWCHTCRYMETAVFTDPAVQGIADLAVWLHVDVDRPENAVFLERVKYDALPTLVMLDEVGKERSRWVGALSADELTTFVATGAGSSQTVAAATQASLHEHWDQVVRTATPVLADTGRPLFERLALSALVVDAQTHRQEPEIIKKASAVLLANLLTEALAAPEEVQQQRADDISSGFETLSEVPAHANFVKKYWVPFLEGQAARATTKSGRAAFDPHRMLAYEFLQDPKRSIPMLQESASDFPNDFNPRARLARVYASLGRFEEAKASCLEARALVYGPRTLRVLEELANIEEKRGDIPAARAALLEIATYKGPLSERGKKAQAAADNRYMGLASRAEEPVPGSHVDGFSKCTRTKTGAECTTKKGAKLECANTPQMLEGKSYLACRDHHPHDGWDIPAGGCMKQLFGALFVADKDGGAVLTTRAAVGAMFKPTSAKSALLLTRIVTDVENEGGSAQGQGPFIVTAPHIQQCGCEHPVSSVTFRVSKDGIVKEMARSVIRTINPGVCFD